MSGTDGPLVPRGPRAQRLVPQSSALVVYTPPRRSWKKTLAAVGLVLLCAAPVTAGVGFLFASDRFSDALGAGGGQADGNEKVGADAWGALSNLGEKVDFSLFVSRASVDAVAALAVDKAKAEFADLGDNGRLQVDAVEIVPSGPVLKLVAHSKLENGFFNAALSARATLQPRLDRNGVTFVATAVDTAIDGADLRKLTFNGGDAAAKAEPAVKAGYARLQNMLAGIASGLVLPVSLPGVPAKGKAKPLNAAFMFDQTGLHVIGRFDNPSQSSDDDLLTGSLGSAGLTLDQYRAAFRAAQKKSIAAASPTGAAELMLSRSAMSALLDDATERTCAPLAVETEPLTLTSQIQLADPPASPQCNRIAASCAARDLCSKQAECADKVVEDTIEETIKVPVPRSGCGRREYICYGWGPYGCEWGQEVCVGPRRVQYRDKVVQRVVSRNEPSTAPQCESLKAMQSNDPGFCDKLGESKAPDCGLVSGSASVSDCEARAAILDRIRDKPTATATLRIVARGKLQSCSRGTISADMGSAKLATTVSGKADIVAEVTIRPDGRADSDSALRCTLEPAAAVKGAAKVQANRSDTIALKASSQGGELKLAGGAEAGRLAIQLDKTMAASLFGAKSGVVYRCQVEGAGGATFAQWESRVGPALEAMAAKGGKLLSSMPAPAFEARLPRAQLLGRDAEAQVSELGAVFVVR